MKLVAWDSTDTRRFTGLSRWWRAGTVMHQLGRGIRGQAFEGRAVTSWEEALRWAASHPRVDELQIWGHGDWGYMDLGRTRLDRGELGRSSDLTASIDALRNVLAPGALFWVRCCSAFGNRAGQEFAPALAERLRCRVAGHTYVIHALQSGTHSVAPGESPDWSVGEGLVRRGDWTRARGLDRTISKNSLPFEPRTLTCLRLDLPPGW